MKGSTVYIVWDNEMPNHHLKYQKQFMTRTNCQKRVNNYNRLTPNRYEVKEVELIIK